MKQKGVGMKERGWEKMGKSGGARRYILLGFLRLSHSKQTDTPTYKYRTAVMTFFVTTYGKYAKIRIHLQREKKRFRSNI